MKLSADLFSGLGSAVGDIFGGAAAVSSASGYKASAAAYRGTAQLYREQGAIYGQMGEVSATNADIAGAGAKLQEVQAGREIYKVLGGQRADIAASGLDTTGSALDIIRSSTQQGQLQLGVLRNQGMLEQQGYKEEQLSYQAMGKASDAASTAALGQASMADAQASAVKKSGAGGILGGVLKGVGAIASVAGLFSDARLKTGIILLDRRDDGIGHYLFRYKGSEQVYLGVLAQEVQQVHPEAVMLDDDSGFFKVDYAAIGETMYHVGRA